MKRARCTGSQIFFSDDEEAQDAAKEVCAGCPVTSECLAYAIETDQPDGVWGGLTTEERQRRVTPGGETPTKISYSTTTRSTGTWCSMGRTPADTWAVVCWTHERTASASSRSTAGWNVSRPEEWCPECRRIAMGLLPRPVS